MSWAAVLSCASKSSLGYVLYRTGSSVEYKNCSQVFTSCTGGECSLISSPDKYFFLLCNFSSEQNQRFFLGKRQLKWRATSEALTVPSHFLPPVSVMLQGGNWAAHGRIFFFFCCLMYSQANEASAFLESHRRRILFQGRPVPHPLPFCTCCLGKGVCGGSAAAGGGWLSPYPIPCFCWGSL